MRAFASEPLSQGNSIRKNFAANSELIPGIKAVSTSSTDSVIQRKPDCACGGGCPRCAGESHHPNIQTKLAISTPGDQYEQEADRVAEQVLAPPAHSAVIGAPLRIQRYTGPATGETDAAPASVDKLLAGSGRPLDPSLRQDMEQRFGHDFSRVRVHSGGGAEQSAQEIDAQAYTVGHSIVFNADGSRPVLTRADG